VEVDANTPAAQLTFSPIITSPIQSPYQFKVTYADNTAINVATISSNPDTIIRVTGPNGFDQLAHLVSVSPATNGSPIVATYEVVAPGGVWNGILQDGFYTVSIEPNTVADTNGNFVEPHALGQFRIAIPLNLVVTNANDSGPGSLRDAIIAANNNSDAPDTITFSNFFNTPQTITLDLGELEITDALTIVGPGAKFATLKGVNSRIFTIDTPDYGLQVSFSGLTMTGGNGNSTVTFSSFPASGGGAIFNLDEALLIDGCVITGNTALGSSDFGGGILLDGQLGSLKLTNSIISNNSASQGGGGISVQNGSIVTIQNCTISSNHVASIGGGSGGGINIANSNPNNGGGGVANVTIEGSTISHNVAFNGGGIFQSGGNGAKLVTVLNITNSTISGNVAQGNGGGISFGNYTNLTIQNATITGNAARVRGGGIAGPSYVASYSGGMNAVVINTIVAGNKNKFTPDLSFGSATNVPMQVINSLIGAVDASMTKITAINSQVGTVAAPLDPLLGPLTDNGGATATHTSTSSLIINKGIGNPIVNLTTLTAIAGSGDTTINVVSATPISVGLAIRIDAEIMTVTAVIGTTIIVLRGQQGTTAAAHSSGASVVEVVSALPANDQRGPGYPRQIGTVDIGAVEMDTTKPTASGQFNPVTLPGAASHTITVTFTDDLALNVATIKNNNNAIRVTGPNGFSVLATYVSLDNPSNGTPRVATYQFTTPVNGAAGWDYTDNGNYTVSIEPNQIADVNGNFVAAGVINAIQVAIGRSLVVINDSDQGPGSLRQAILDANANPGFDTITFNSYFNTARTIPVGALGEMFITDPVTITGPGAPLATIDGENLNRIFNIDLPAATWGGAVNISGLTFFQGVGITATGSEGPGGAINNESAVLTMTGCDFAENGNLTFSGGVFNLGSIYAPLSLTNCNFNQNGAYSGAVADVSGGISTIYDSLTVTVNNCTFTGNSGGAGFGSGGVFNVSNGGTINIQKSSFTSNSAGTGGGSGGAVMLGSKSTANITDSVFDGNSAGEFGNGGAISISDSTAIATIVHSTLKNNVAGASTGSSFGGNGGAIYVTSGGRLVLDSSTVSGNTSNSTGTYGVGGGGGIYMTGSAQVVIANSTISGNKSQSHGGGILVNYLTNDPNPVLSGSLVIRNATIAFNSATTDGGGIHFANSSSGTPSVSMTSTIVSENTSAGASDLTSGTGDASTTFTVNNSFIGNPIGAVITGANNKNTAANGTVNLSPTLALNGAPAGSPLTHALIGPSAAIDSGINPDGLNFDQRGNGFSRTVNKATDMGSFEVQNAAALPTVTTIVVNDGSTQRSMITSIKITFSEAVTFPNGINNAFTLTRTTAPTGGALGSVNISAVQVGNVVTLTFLNGGAVTLDQFGSLPDGKYSLNIISNRVAGVGGFLDGNINGSFQGSPIDDKSVSFYRLFGDGNGDGVVNSTDFAAFRSTFGVGSNLAFDYDGDGVVNSNDFAEFRKRFGLSI